MPSVPVVQLIFSALGGGGAWALVQLLIGYLRKERTEAQELREDLAQRVSTLQERVQTLEEQLQHERRMRLRAEIRSERLLAELNKLRRAQGLDPVETSDVSGDTMEVLIDKDDSKNEVSSDDE